MEKQRSMAVNGYRSFFVLVDGFNPKGDLTCFNIGKLVYGGERELYHSSADSAFFLPRNSHKLCPFSPVVFYAFVFFKKIF